MRQPTREVPKERQMLQDHMAWETQGPIADRATEHPSYSDRGIAFFRKLTSVDHQVIRVTHHANWIQAVLNAIRRPVGRINMGSTMWTWWPKISQHTPKIDSFLSGHE